MWDSPADQTPLSGDRACGRRCSAGAGIGEMMSQNQATRAAVERRRMAAHARRLTEQAQVLAAQVQQVANEDEAHSADPHQIAAHAQSVAEHAQQMAQEAEGVAAERQVLAEELAAHQERERARLQQVLDLLPEAVVIADTTAVTLVGNKAAGEILEAEPLDLVGQPPFVAGPPTAPSAAMHLDGTPYPVTELPLQRAVLRGEVVRGEQLVLRTASREVPILANAAPLRDAAGAITGGVLVFQDITALRDLDRLRQEYLFGAAHDLRTPLTVIRGYTQLALRHLARVPDPASTPVAGHLKSIEDAAVRMLGLTTELVDVTRLQVGGVLDLEREPTDLVELVRAVAEQHQHLTPQRIEVDAAVPALEATVDAARLERVVTNLLANAMKYSPPTSTITLRVAREDGMPGPVAAIAVRDAGLGIPAADLPHIFERFRRASNVVGRMPGLGLGLASARQIMEQHRGTITVESAEGTGSTFTVRVPLDAPAPA